jgi:hypothetical protein
MPVEVVVQNVLTSLIVGLTFVGIAFSPLARALGNRIMHGRMPAPGGGGEDPRVDDLMDELAATRRQMDELQERVDFAERLLAQARERGLLNAGER